MTTGLEIYNDQGRLQFSTLKPTPVLVAKGSQATTVNPGTSNTPGVTSTRIEISSLSEAAVLAFKPNGCTIAFAFGDQVSGVHRYTFMVVGSGTIDWWAFDLAAPDPSFTSGLQLFDEAGNLCWQSHRAPMRVAAFVSQNLSAGSLGDQTVAVPSGRNYALAIGMRSGYANYIDIGEPDGSADRWSSRYRLDGITLAASVYTISIRIFDQSAGFTTNPADFGYTKYFSPRNMMVLDVTGY